MIGEVRGVVGASGLLELELGAPEGGAELGDQLFGAVGPITEPARQVPIEPRPVTGPVDVLLSAPSRRSASALDPPSG